MKLEKDEREIQLAKYAQEIGCSLQGTLNPRTGRRSEAEVVARIINTERSIREENLWKLVLISATASLASAITAMYKVEMVN